MTKGEYRVGTDFNPSGDGLVDEIKQRAADLIDMIEGIPLPEMPHHELPTEDRMRLLSRQGEIGRLKALAQTEIESAAHWAVKAATKPEPKL